MIFKELFVFAHFFFSIFDSFFIAQKEFEKSVVLQTCRYINKIYLIDRVYCTQGEPFVQKDFE